MKTKTMIIMAVSTLFLLGCGIESSNKKKELTAEDMLVCKTFYTVDKDLNEPSGYYKEKYTISNAIETEYAEDGTQINKDFIMHASYDKDNITVSLGDVSITCKVTQFSNRIELNCDDGSVSSQWNSKSEIQR